MKKSLSKRNVSKPPKNDVTTPIFQCQYSHFRIPFKKLSPTHYLIHTLEYLEKPTYCAWGLKNRGDCVQGPLNKRKFGDEIVNKSRPTQRPSQVKTGCKECSKALHAEEVLGQVARSEMRL